MFSGIFTHINLILYVPCQARYRIRAQFFKPRSSGCAVMIIGNVNVALRRRPIGKSSRSESQPLRVPPAGGKAKCWTLCFDRASLEFSLPAFASPYVVVGPPPRRLRKLSRKIALAPTIPAIRISRLLDAVVC